MIGDRPFIQMTWRQLEKMADAFWHDSQTLQEILAELPTRKRLGALRLRVKIAGRLVELSKESFLWPSTAALPSSKALDDDQFWYENGLLSFMGYRVGSSGIPVIQRYDVLDYVYSERVPQVNSAAYMREWGEPKSGKRLKKLADSLASFARNAQRRRFANMEDAVSDWGADLHYLKEAYYDGRYDFEWPALEGILAR